MVRGLCEFCNKHVDAVALHRLGCKKNPDATRTLGFQTPKNIRKGTGELHFID